jgi:hypothetical protein
MLNGLVGFQLHLEPACELVVVHEQQLVRECVTDCQVWEGHHPHGDALAKRAKES